MPAPVQAYELETPQEPGEVQEDYKIGKTGAYVISIKACLGLILAGPFSASCCSAPGCFTVRRGKRSRR